MDLYIFPEFETLLRASVLLVALGLLGFLLARRHRFGVVLALIILAVACWQVVVPLVPPAGMSAGNQADLWRQIMPVLFSGLAAVILIMVGVRMRRSRPAA
jgi:heme/copper-type cytochrome/quinol oxidase subunit 4